MGVVRVGVVVRATCAVSKYLNWHASAVCSGDHHGETILGELRERVTRTRRRHPSKCSRDLGGGHHHETPTPPRRCVLIPAIASPSPTQFEIREAEQRVRKHFRRYGPPKERGPG